MIFNDSTPMPFGKHVGTKLENVPADYLLWMYDNIKEKHVTKRSFNEKELLKYIEDNKDVLIKESKK